MADPQLYAFVDNSNVLIEGRRFAEMKRKGRSTLSAFKDNRYEIDWGKFLYVLKEKDSRALADVPTLYGSRPPAQDSVWNRIRDDGFDVKLFDRNIRHKEKGVDMEMGMDIVQLLFTVPTPKVIVIAAGDADYVPVIERAKGKGWRVEVWFWSNAAVELKKAANRFCELDPHMEFLRLGGGVV
jgi:uncharacterized LabA/DUF88 family protein